MLGYPFFCPMFLLLEDAAGGDYAFFETRLDTW